MTSIIRVLGLLNVDVVFAQDRNYFNVLVHFFVIVNLIFF